MLPSLCCGDRKCVRIVLAVLVFSVFASLASAQTDTWVGTSGKWSDPTQWDNGVPVTGDNIVIGTATANSIDDLSLSISGLTLGNSADALTIPKGVALNDTGPISNAGTLDILPGAIVNVGSVTQINNGVLIGGQWVLDSNLNITGPAAQIVTNSATVTLSGGAFKNAGGSDAFSFLAYNTNVLRIMNFAKLSPANTVVNTGQVTIAQGCKLTFSSGFGYQQNSGKTTNDGVIVNGVQIDGGTYLGAGRVAGDLGIGATSGTGATFSVGDAGKAGLAQVTGTYFQWPNGILSTGIGGITFGSQYSQLRAGHATLAGTLAAPLLNGFTPTVGETFTVLIASPVTGTFSNTTIPINSSEHFAISYTTRTVVLTVVSGPSVE
jgi:hypothetical protein